MLNFDTGANKVHKEFQIEFQNHIKVIVEFRGSIQANVTAS